MLKKKKIIYLKKKLYKNSLIKIDSNLLKISGFYGVKEFTLLNYKINYLKINYYNYLFFKKKDNYNLFLNNLFYNLIGLNFGYVLDIQFLNMNYKIHINNILNELVLFIGQSHGNILKYNKNIIVYLKKKKKILRLLSFGKLELKILGEHIKNLKVMSIYKNRGIKYLNEKVSFKNGKNKQNK